jgi:hypothetical protein
MKSEIALAEGRGVTGAALAADDSINNVNKQDVARVCVLLVTHQVYTLSLPYPL